MALKLIYAADANGAIGNKGTLPWPKIGADMQRFRNATMGSCCIMGRKTFESLPGGLDGRQMIVITSSHIKRANVSDLREGKTLFVPNFNTARKCAPDAFVIGGSRVFIAASECVDEVWFTWINGVHEADTFMCPAQELFAPPMFDCWEETQVDLRCRFYRFRRK